MLAALQIWKKAVSEDIERKEKFCVALANYGVSLKQYEVQLKTPKRKKIC